MKRFGVVAVLLTSAALGALLVTTTAQEEFVLVVPKVVERVPAALNDSAKLRTLQEKILKVTHKDKIWEKTLITTLTDVVTVQLPQVALRDTQGRDNLACLIFDQVTLRFVADGQATSGEKAELELTAPCEFNIEQPEVLEVLVVPFEEIRARPAKNESFTLANYQGYVFKTHHVMGEWPVAWILREVSYQHQNGTTAQLMAPQLTPGDAPLPTMIW